MRRSMLFLPGNTPNMIINGDALGADSIILDLEDAVSPDEKDSARLLVRSAMKNMGFAGCEITVRINSIDTDYWKDDLEAVIPLKPDLIMPPKASCAEDMRIIDEYIAGIERLRLRRRHRRNRTPLRHGSRNGKTYSAYRNGSRC